MSRLDDLTAELLDKLGLTDNAAAIVETRQRLQAAWEEGQLAMRTRCSEEVDRRTKLTPEAREAIVLDQVDSALRNLGQHPDQAATPEDRTARAAARETALIAARGRVEIDGPLAVAVSEEFK